MGILYAGAFADCVAFILAVVFLTREVKLLKRKHWKSIEEKEKWDSLNKRTFDFSTELFEVVNNRSLLSN